MDSITPLFYRNPSGLWGVSCDEGETLILPSGKVLLPIPKAWEETDEEVEEGVLSLPQEEAVKKCLDTPPMTEIEQIAWRLRKASLAKARMFNTRRVAVGDPSSDRPNNKALLRSLEARDVLVVKSDFDD